MSTLDNTTALVVLRDGLILRIVILRGLRIRLNGILGNIIAMGSSLVFQKRIQRRAGTVLN